MDCLQSINSQTGVTVETIVIDNASKDNTAAYLKDQHLKKILSSRNLGFGAAANLAASQAEGQYIFVLNPDTILPPDALKNLFEFAECTPRAGLISAMLVYQNGQPQLSARTLPRRRDIFLGRGSPLFKLSLSDEKKAGYIIPPDNQPLRVPSISATAVLIKHEIFKDIGGFDSRFFMYLEDVDICRRIREKGLEIWMLPEVKIKHSWRKSSNSRPYFASYLHHISVYKYFCKYEPKKIFHNLSLLIFLTIGYVFNSVITFLKKSGNES